MHCCWIKTSAGVLDRRLNVGGVQSKVRTSVITYASHLNARTGGNWLDWSDGLSANGEYGYKSAFDMFTDSPCGPRVSGSRSLASYEEKH